MGFLPATKWTALLFLFAFLSTRGCAASGVEDPTGEVNLDKNTAYNNALKCFSNESSICPAALNESGVVKVNDSTATAYCGRSGCANQTLVQLKCVSEVWSDFSFNNGASVEDVKRAISNGCKTGNFTVLHTSHAMGSISHLPFLFTLACVIGCFITLIWSMD